MKSSKHYFPHFLFTLYLIEFVILAINPYDRSVWWAENLPILIVVVLLVLTYKKFRFSNLSYALMTFFLMFHTIGGHYTFSQVPFDFFNNILIKLPLSSLVQEGRNNFDRVGHFLVGVFAFPVAELFFQKKWVSNVWTAVLLGIFALGFWGALYEVIEMIYAVKAGGEAGIAFLGSQGDIWDAQKDMALDISGAMMVSVLFLVINKDKKKLINN